MYGQVFGCCIHGIEGKLVEVEVDIANGLPQIQLVGLPDSAIRESTDRVRAAIQNSGFKFPQQRVTINLAPADLKKEGAAFDLAIAAALLVASGQLSIETERTLFIGELSLDGSVRPVPGVLSMVSAAKQAGFKRVVLPFANAAEGTLISDIVIHPVERLADLNHIGTDINTINYQASITRSDSTPQHDDYADVRGQHHAKRALTVAAAGRHHLLFIGPPGSGKTMLARRLPGILPDLNEDEAIEVARIHSVARKLQPSHEALYRRPFRSPHHTISAAGLIGGGGIPRPGEVSLAHHGVLFLDELPEFSRSVLEVMRQPIEDGFVTIGRARAACTFPTQFMLVCSMNPCPCGFAGATGGKSCNCPSHSKERYFSKISGPLLDRIDLHVEVPNLTYKDLKQEKNPLSSEQMRAHIGVAIERQTYRYRDETIHRNGELSGDLLHRYCSLTASTNQMLQEYYDAMSLSIRSHDRILKVARTIADLEDSADIAESHLAEAMQYRVLDQV